MLYHVIFSLPIDMAVTFSENEMTRKVQNIFLFLLLFGVIILSGKSSVSFGTFYEAMFY